MDLFKKGRKGRIHSDAYATIDRLFEYDIEYTNCSRYKKLKKAQSAESDALLKSATEKRAHINCI
jgi:hypothetical protein